MTPHELNLHIHSYQERTRREDENQLLVAYLVSAWHPMRTKRMPKWNEIVKKDQKTQTDEQMLAMVKAMTVAMGGTINESGK